MKQTFEEYIQEITSIEHNVKEYPTFDEFMDAFKKQLKYFIDIKIEGNLIIERIYAKLMPAPFLSILIDDCIKKGKDYYNGGARYNSAYIQGVGTGTITDSLAAIKQVVFGVFVRSFLSYFYFCQFSDF